MKLGVAGEAFEVAEDWEEDEVVYAVIILVMALFATKVLLDGHRGTIGVRNPVDGLV